MDDDLPDLWTAGYFVLRRPSSSRNCGHNAGLDWPSDCYNREPTNDRCKGCSAGLAVFMISDEGVMVPRPPKTPSERDLLELNISELTAFINGENPGNSTSLFLAL